MFLVISFPPSVSSTDFSFIVKAIDLFIDFESYIILLFWLIIFEQWVRYLEDGSVNYIIGNVSYFILAIVVLFSLHLPKTPVPNISWQQVRSNLTIW